LNIVFKGVEVVNGWMDDDDDGWMEKMDESMNGLNELDWIG